MSDDVLIRAEHVSKKFCRSLKRALWYGVRDIGHELLGRNGHHEQLRPGEFWAVDDVSFQVRRGECLGLIGPNGAGKSTLLKMLNGLIKPDRGRITIRGRVGALIELGTGFNPILTGRENIYNNAAVLGLSKREVDKKLDEIIDFAELPEDALDAPVQSYSSGMRARLGFAVAVHVEPDVLLVDEVLAVGDVGFRFKSFKRLRGLLNFGTTVIVVTHSLTELSRVTSRALVMDDGTRAFDGDLSRATCIYEELSARGTQGDEYIRPGAPTINSCVLTDDYGRPRTEFCTGDTIVINARLSSTRPFHNCRLWVCVEGAVTGILSTFSSAMSGLSICVDCRTDVKVELPNVPLLVGKYYIQLVLLGPDMDDQYHRLGRAASFSIVGPPTDALANGWSGVLILRHAFAFPKTSDISP